MDRHLGTSSIIILTAASEVAPVYVCVPPTDTSSSYLATAVGLFSLYIVVCWVALHAHVLRSHAEVYSLCA